MRNDDTRNNRNHTRHNRDHTSDIHIHSFIESHYSRIKEVTTWTKTRDTTG